MSRFGGPLSPLGGGHPSQATDPTYTRWLPLAFSPQISSQPFRYQAGALPAPWGNINCMYSPALRQEPDTPNYDLNGTVGEYMPIQFDGQPLNLGPPYIGIKPLNTPKFSIMDANGDRLLFGLGLGPFSDVHSTLGLGTGDGLYYLFNAGPPGAMKQKGHYTYTFLRTSAQNAPLTTQLLSIADDLGNKQAIGYGASGLTVRDSSSGRVLIFTTGANGYVTGVDAPEAGYNNGIHTHTALTWDGSGHCTGIGVYAGGSNALLHSDVFGYGGPNGDSVTSEQQGVSVASFSYANDGLLPDPFGQSTPRLASATYGSYGDTSSSDDGGSVAGTILYTYGPTQQGYNAFGVDAHTNTVTDPRGSVFTTLFGLSGDVWGDITSLTTTGPAYSGAPGGNSSYTQYTPNILQPQTVAVYGPNYYLYGLPWTASFDPLGNLTQITDPFSHSWQYAYTPDGLHLTQATDPTNVTANLAYGERGSPSSRLTSVQSAAGGTTQIDYNTFGQPTAITTPAGSSASGQNELTQFAYDPTTGDLTGAINPLGDLLRVTGYDALGDPLGATLFPDTGNPATSAQPLTSSILYDAAQMPFRITGPNGVSLNTTFTNGVMTQFQTQDTNGSVLAQMNLNYDSRGRMYQATDPLGTLAQYRFDKNSNVTQVWDGLGNKTFFFYGKNNEPTGVTWASGGTTVIRYDAGGRVSQTQDETNALCNYVYDADDRLTDIQRPNSAAENVHYTYDNAGRLLTVTDASGKRTYIYDAVSGRLMTVQTLYSGLPAGHNIAGVVYGYYPDGKVAQRTGIDGTTLYGYDANGRLTTLTDPQNSVTTYAYDHAGRVTGQSTTTAGGKTFATGYTWGVSGLTGDPSSAPIYVRQINESVNGQSVAAYTLTHTLTGELQEQLRTGVDSRFVYDKRGRLTSEAQIWSGPTRTTVVRMMNGAYTYDAANNVQPQNGGWQSNAGNQLTSAPAIAGNPGLAGATGLTYNNSGDMTLFNGGALSYNCWGDLTGAGNATYAYDSSGRRISKTVGTATTYYVYDGETLLAELDGGGNVTRRYTWGPLGLVSDTGLVNGSLQTRLYGYDAQGNTCLLTDGGTGATLWQGTWTAWGGEHDLSGGACPTPFGYKGQTGAYCDAETGLLKMGARYYAPCIGRFLSRDPSGFAAGTNLYAFCMGDPVNFFDASGCDAEGVGGLFWKGVGLADSIEKAAQGVGLQTSGIPGALLGAHDAFQNWGASAGNTKKSAHDTQVDAFYAAVHFGNATMACTGPVLMTMRALGESEAAVNACKNGTCFVAGTLVWTAYKDASGQWHVGTKRIEEVKQNEYVIARNEQTGKVEYKKVLRTTVLHTDVTVSVTLADAKSGQAQEVITASREHPFYVNGKGFVPAGGLAIGNAIVTRAGPALVVQNITWNRRPEGYTVYNFEVEDDHSYFVGNANGGAWVHNYPKIPHFSGPWSSPSPHVGNLANAIEQSFPGHVVGVDRNIYNAAGQLVTDLDIETENAIIQVKSGSGDIGKQITSSQSIEANPTGKPVIGYSPGFGKHAIREINGRGGIGTNDWQAVIDIVRP